MGGRRRPFSRSSSSSFVPGLLAFMVAATLGSSGLATEGPPGPVTDHLFSEVIVSSVSASKASIKVSTRDLNLKVNQSVEVDYAIVPFNSSLPKVVVVTFSASKDGVVLPIPSVVIETNATATEFAVNFTAVGKGKTVVLVNTSDPNIEVLDASVEVQVYGSEIVSKVSDVVGWIYFVAWSVSFYPQIYQNFRRKSVVGLNFDFLAMNVFGFALYSAFNIGLFSSASIQEDYEARHNTGVIPVKVNDVVFSVHAFVACLVTCAQCLLYESGSQRISKLCVAFLCAVIAYMLVGAIVSGVGVMLWLDYLLVASYIKLSITIIKYMPQAYMNYRRQSTVGWSIGNILLDFTGGALSILQMALDSMNYDDWTSFFGDPTKFGLGVFSIAFDILFIVQHYLLYRNSEQDSSPSDAITDSERPIVSISDEAHLLDRDHPRYSNSRPDSVGQEELPP